MINPVGVRDIPTAVVDSTVRVHKTRNVAVAEARKAPPAGIHDIPTIVTDITIRIYVAGTTNTTTVRRV